MSGWAGAVGYHRKGGHGRSTARRAPNQAGRRGWEKHNG
jgi:hypothetical protein